MIGCAKATIVAVFWKLASIHGIAQIGSAVPPIIAIHGRVALAICRITRVEGTEVSVGWAGYRSVDTAGLWVA